MVKRPYWLRILNIAAGIVFLALGAGVLLDFGFTQQVLILILSFTLVLVALARAVNGLSDPTLSEKLKYINMFVGAVGLSMAAAVIFIPDLPMNTAILLLGIGLGFQGIARIAVGGTDQTLAIWVRGLMITVGAITLVISLVAIFLQTTDETILLAILAYAFIANGLARIIKELFKSPE